MKAKYKRYLIIPVVAFVISMPIAAQETSDSTRSTRTLQAIGADSDPSRPILYALREEFYELNDNTFINQFIFRIDQAVFEQLDVPGPAKGILARLDIPIRSFSNPSIAETGLGPVYVQALVAPRIQGAFCMAAVTGLVLPTETSPLLGFGKWIAAPAILPIWFLPQHGLTYIKFQDWISFAGQSDRPDVHYLTVTPAILLKLSKRWFTFFEAESNTNWLNEGRTWYKAGALIGYVLSKRKSVWLKTEIPFGQYQEYNWIIKASYYVTRR